LKVYEKLDANFNYIHNNYQNHEDSNNNETTEEFLLNLQKRIILIKAYYLQNNCNIISLDSCTNNKTN